MVRASEGCQGLTIRDLLEASERAHKAAKPKGKGAATPSGLQGTAERGLQAA